jgi:hypothetical protein
VNKKVYIFLALGILPNFLNSSSPQGFVEASPMGSSLLSTPVTTIASKAIQNYGRSSLTVINSFVDGTEQLDFLCNPRRDLLTLEAQARQVIEDERLEKEMPWRYAPVFLRHAVLVDQRIVLSRLEDKKREEIEDEIFVNYKACCEAWSLVQSSLRLAASYQRQILK